MNKDLQNEMQVMADEIREQAKQLRHSTFLLFINTADICTRYQDIMLSKYPVGRTGVAVLHYLILHGGTMTPTELSSRVFRSKHAITRMVDTLEKQGFVKRAPIGRDRRVRKVMITAKGLAFTKEIRSLGAQRIGTEMFSALNQKKTKEFQTTLRQIKNHILGLIEKSQEK